MKPPEAGSRTAARTGRPSNAQSAAAPAVPLLAHVDRLMEGLHAQVPKALNQWDVEGIHQARVATRRLKAALDLMKPVLAKKRRRPLAGVLRRLRRRLGPLRDADVMLEHLGDLAASAPKQADAVAWLSRHLCQQRDALRRASTAEGKASQVLADLGAWHPVREQMDDGRDALNTLLTQSLHLQLDTFAEQADRLVGRLPQPAPGANGSAVGVAAAASPQDPHALRIAGKALRYTLEMAAAHGHDVPASVMKTFKKMQEFLGGWHDFVVLMDQAMRASLEEILGHHDAAMQEKVLELARMTLRRSGQQLDQFIRLWNSKGDELARTIRAAFPLTAAAEPASSATAPPAAPPTASASPPPATELQTGPGPSGSAQTQVPEAPPPAAPSAAS